jgi:hypothetical protein
VAGCERGEADGSQVDASDVCAECFKQEQNDRDNEEDETQVDSFHSGALGTT